MLKVRLHSKENQLWSEFHSVCSERKCSAARGLYETSNGSGWLCAESAMLHLVDVSLENFGDVETSKWLVQD